MSKLLQVLGLETSPEQKAAHAKSAERFREQIVTRSVTEASQVNKVAQKQLRKALRQAITPEDPLGEALSQLRRDLWISPPPPESKEDDDNAQGHTRNT